MTLGKFGTGTAHIPWMQADTSWSPKQKALPYCLVGRTVNALSYDQLAAWASALKRRQQALAGFPAGRRG